MVGIDSDGIAVPDVDGAEVIENKISELRKEIKIKCTTLLLRAKEIDGKKKSRAFKLRYWEDRISEIRNNKRATVSIDGLNELKEKCDIVLKEMERFE